MSQWNLGQAPAGHQPQLFIMLDDSDRQRLRQVLMVVLLLHLHNSIHTRHYLHRPAIVMPANHCDSGSMSRPIRRHFFT